jgi:hypothetical protein
VRSIGDFRRLIRVLRSELAAQQYDAEYGHLEIGDAMMCLEEAEGFLAVAESEIEHEERLEAAE